jgi:hypothetical protein
VVEVGHFFPEVEVFHQGRTPVARFQGVIGVVDAHALVGSQVDVLFRFFIVIVSLIGHSEWMKGMIWKKWN